MSNSQETTIRIHPRQMAWLVSIVLIAGGLLLLPREVARVAGQDGWLTYSIPFAYAFGVVVLFYRLSRLLPGKNLFEINRELAGPLLGSLFNLLLIAHFAMLYMRDLASISRFVNSTLLSQTPQEFIELLIVLLAMYMGRLGLETQARVNDMLYPLFFLLMITLPLIMANEVALYRLQPMYVTQVSDWYAASMLNTGWMGDIFIVGAFLHTVVNSKALHAALRHGLTATLLILTLTSSMLVLVLGSNVTAKTLYPTYLLVQQINITEFLDRLELFVLSLWLPLVFMKMNCIYIAILYGIASFWKNRNTEAFSYIAGWTILLLTILLFPTMSEIFSYGNYTSVFNTLAVELPLIATLVLLGWRRSRKAGRSAANDGWRDSLLARKNVRTNMIAAVVLLFSFAGFFYARTSPFYGNVCAALYAVALLLLYLSTYGEKRRVNKLLRSS